MTRSLAGGQVCRLCGFGLGRVLGALAVALALLGPASVMAQAEARIHYQGVLLDSSGNPLDGVTTVTFRLYDAPTGGNLLWSENPHVTVSEGVFSVLLGHGGSIVPGLFDSGERWLELEVGGEILSPRQPIASVPRALNAERLQGLTAGDLQGGQGSLSVPRTTTLQALDTAPGIATGASSITIGSDGFPVVAYYDSSGQDLKVLHCRTLDCSVADDPVAVDTEGDAGSHASIAIGADGLPVISYRRDGSLQIAHCSDPACKSASLQDLAGSTPLDISIAIGADGFPVVAYAMNGEAHIIACSDPSCASPAVESRVGNEAQVSEVALALAPDGSQWVAYRAGENLFLARCSASAAPGGWCIDPSANHPINTGFDYSPIDHEPLGIAITVGNDGVPVISYQDEEDGAIWLVHASGYPYPSVGIIGSGGPVSEGYTSVSIGSDGFPVVAFYEPVAADLKIVKCGSVDCTPPPSAVGLDESGDVGRFNSMTIGSDGRPLVSYVDSSGGPLKVARCGNPFCSPYWTRR